MSRLIDADALLATLPNYESYKDVIDLITNAPTVQRELVVDCRTCANKGVINGLSQEAFCEHCIHSTSWKRNYYKPQLNAPEKG
jgi:hypothetical protein